MKRILFIVILILFSSIYIQAEDSGSVSDTINTCLRFKAEGDFSAAYQSAEKLYNREDSECQKMALHLIDEITCFPDVVPLAVSCLERIKNRKVSNDVERLYSLISLHLLARKGQYDRTELLCKNLGFIRQLNVSRPLHVESGESTEVIRSSLDTRFPGNDSEDFFVMKSDREGVFEFDSLYPKVGQKAFKAVSTLHISSDGFYRIYTGRAGKLIMNIDGERVIEADDSVSYSPDQNCVRGFLRKGVHHITFYLTGDAANNLQLNICIVPDTTSDNETVASGWKTEVESFKDNFIGGFITYKKGLSGLRNTVKESMEKISTDDVLHPYACYYSAQAENDDANSWKILEEGTSKFIDPVIAIYKIQKEFNRYGMNDSYTLCRRMTTEYPRSVFTDICNLELSLQSGWTEETLKRINSLEARGYPLLADQYRIWSAFEYEEKGSPYSSYANLFKSGIDGIKTLKGLAVEMRSWPKTDAWYDLLERSIARDGYGTTGVLAAAEYQMNKKRYDKAIPMFSSLMKNAPDNPEVMYDFGRIYFELGKTDLSKFYFGKAYESDPQNGQYRLAVKYLSSSESPKDEFPDNALIKKGKEKRNNAVVCLERKMEIEIGQTGEFEKRVKESYLINDAGKAGRISKRSVIIDETLESLDDIRYYAVHSGKKKESRSIEHSSLSDEQSGIYSDLMQYDITAPGFNSGDILIFEYSIRSIGTAEKGCYDERIQLGGEYDTLVSKLVLTDKSGSLNWKVYNCNPQISVTKKNGKSRTINLVLNNIECIPDEKAMVPNESIIPEIRISSFSTYDELYTWFHSRTEERSGLSADIQSTIDTITKNISDKKSKASAIYKYFTDKIRYIGFENNRGGYIPRKGSETFKSGAGDCKDTAFLVEQAMQYAGIDADIVLLMTNDVGITDRTFPSLSAFNHAICRINLDKPVYLDCTVNGREIDELPDEDRDVYAFVISGKKGYFEKINAGDYIQKKERVYSEVRIHTDGRIEAERNILKTGYPVYHETEDGSREDDVYTFWNEHYPGVTFTGFSAENKERTDITRYNLVISNYAYVSDDEIVFPVHILKSILPSYTKYPTRKTDMRISGGQEIESVIKYTIPEGFKVASIPDNVDVIYSGIKFRTDYRKDKNSVTVTTNIMVKTFDVSVKDYSEFRDAMRRISVDQNAVISLIKGE